MRESAMLDQGWALDPSVALRPEPFGALAYHVGTRKLVFLKRPELVAVVEQLAGSTSVRLALEGAGVSQAEWPAYVAALSGLADAEIIRRVREVAA